MTGQRRDKRRPCQAVGTACEGQRGMLKWNMPVQATAATGKGCPAGICRENLLSLAVQGSFLNGITDTENVQLRGLRRPDRAV